MQQPGGGGKQHEAHDGRAADGLAPFGNGDLRVEALGGLHELRGGAGVQPATVDDLEGARGDARVSHAFFESRHHDWPARTWLATLI